MNLMPSIALFLGLEERKYLLGGLRILHCYRKARLFLDVCDN